MDRPSNLPAAALEPHRQRAIQQLIEHFAADHLTTEALEERLDRAHQATSLAALQELTTDLPAMGPAGASPLELGSAVPAPARAGYVPERQLVMAIMGGAARTGAWTPPEHLYVVTVMGGAELDFRSARLGAVTEVTIFALMGGVEVVVPPGVHVELNGIAVMGAFEQHGRVDPPTDPDAPVIRIGGFAMMGGVEVKYRLPGEKDKDARRREKLEARAHHDRHLGPG